MDRLVLWIVKTIAFAAKHRGSLISLFIAAILVVLLFVVFVLGSYESWDRTIVGIATGVISSVITTAFLLIVRWIGMKSSHSSMDVFDVLGYLLWSKCLWGTARARLRRHGYCRYEAELFGGLMGKVVVIRAIYDSGNWKPQVVVGDEVVYGFGTGDDLGIGGKSRDDVLEDARKFAVKCGLSMRIEINEMGGSVVETPKKIMFIIRNLLYRSANVLREESHRKPGECENLIGEIDEMLRLLHGARIYFGHGRWDRDERDDLVKSLMELIRKTMVALSDYEYGEEPDSDRLVKDLKNELSDVEHDLFSSAKKIVLADSNSRHENRLSRYRRRVSEAPSRLWSRARGRQ